MDKKRRTPKVYIPIGVNEDAGLIHSKKWEREGQALLKRVVVTEIELCPDVCIEGEHLRTDRVASAASRRKGEASIVQVEELAGLKNCGVGLNDGDVPDVGVGCRERRANQRDGPGTEQQEQRGSLHGLAQG